jgi:hypothetical protein
VTQVGNCWKFRLLNAQILLNELTGEAFLGRLHPGKEVPQVRHMTNHFRQSCEKRPLSRPGVCPELPGRLPKDEGFAKAHLM